MKQPEFERLCNDLARIWTRKDGALARLGRCSASVGSHILCLGAKSNTGLLLTTASYGLGTVRSLKAVSIP